MSDSMSFNFEQNEHRPVEVAVESSLVTTLT